MPGYWTTPADKPKQTRRKWEVDSLVPRTGEKRVMSSDLRLLSRPSTLVSLLFPSIYGERADALQVLRTVFDSAVDEPELFGHIASIGVAPGYPVELTSGPSQTSAMFTQSSLPRSVSFKATITFHINAAGGGADGLALVFTADKGLGLDGYGMGYSGLGYTGDFAVEGELTLA